MNLLALDTATELCSVAITSGGETLYRDAFAPRSHTELILPMVEELLIETKLRLDQMDALVFDRGPGAFTGVRIATSVVQGLAFGAGLPVIGVSSLAALAQGAHRCDGAHHVLSCIDARMGEVYWACYELNGEQVTLQGEEQVSPPAAVATVGDADYLGAGSGWASYQSELLANPHVRVSNCEGERYPHALDLLQLAIPLYQQRRFHDPMSVVPQYVRNDVVAKKARPGS
jgi:tRNA threonylcarbamoyladenosine biosynthesis protein TsaB